MLNDSQSVDAQRILSRAREVMDVEISGVRKVRDELGEPFVALVKKCLEILQDGGKLVLCGVGKSGHISKKLAATLASTGARAVFMHPVEAMHGDLGVVSPQDLLLAVSYSGETDELLRVLPAVKRMGVPIVGITGKAESRLGTFSDMVVPMPVEREACPFNLAPTTTTTALLALGDALAMVLLDCQNFQLSDYAKNHPAGAIGRTITLTVKDCMRTGERCAVVTPQATVREALLAMGDREMKAQVAEKDLALATPQWLSQLAGRPLSLQVEADPAVAGGIRLVALDGSRTYDNTYGARLGRLQEEFRREVAACDK